MEQVGQPTHVRTVILNKDVLLLPSGLSRSLLKTMLYSYNKAGVVRAK